MSRFNVTAEYRVATSADADLIAELHADSWRRAYRGMFSDEFLDGDLVANRQGVWRERLGQPPVDQFVCVAEVGGEIAGFVCAFGAHDAEWGSLIDNLHVAAHRRRLGIASELMRRAGEWLVSAYPERAVYLWAMEANAPARRFYKSLGATIAEIVTNEVHPGTFARSCRHVWPSPRALTGSR